MWAELVKQWNVIPTPVHPSVTLGPEVIVVGRDDNELDDHTDDNSRANYHNFGWDNESPCRNVEVGRFKVEFRPITVKEFYEFWVGGADERVSVNLPANWVEDGRKIKVRSACPPFQQRK
jgi:formylglycine-generating enzyme required for sulfatase activity